MKAPFLIIMLLMLVGCGGELAAAQAAANGWMTAAIVGTIIALLVGVALGSRKP